MVYKIFMPMHHESYENHSNIDYGSDTDPDTATFTHTKRSKVCYIYTDTESNNINYKNARGNDQNLVELKTENIRL